MNNSQSIPPKNAPFAPNAPKHSDFDFLREEGLQHIRDLSGQLWTDHNTHDPGITILEVLCYALTDLAYRTQLPDADLFAPNPQKRLSGSDDNFPSAYTILSCNPVTMLDWRKLLLDIKGVRNAWVEPIETVKSKGNDKKQGLVFEKNGESQLWENDLWTTESLVLLDKEKAVLTLAESFEKANERPTNYPLSIRGVYKIRLEFEQNVVDKAPILAKVRERLANHRNLCEDFADISIVQDESLTLCGEIELDATAQPDTVLLDIFNRIQEFFSPTIKFYTLREMLKKGLTMEEIFEGRPMLPDAHGFVDTAELESVILPKEIRVSDLYHLILGDDLTENPEGLPKIAGVSAIKKLLVLTKNASASQIHTWKVPITEGARPTLNVAESIVGMTFFKRGVPYRVNGARVANLFEKQLENPTKINYSLDDTQKKGHQNLDAVIPTGEFREDLHEYWSIQHDFPAVYGIGASALPETVGVKRQAQSLQLKGYLTFFDHLLANYLAQLANIRTLFSSQLTNNGVALPDGESAEKEWLGLSPNAFTPIAPVADLRKNIIPNAHLLFGFAQTDEVLEIGNDAQKTHKPFFTEGEIIAEGLMTYPTPHDRDRALRQFIAIADAGKLTTSIEKQVQPNENDQFFFILSSQLGRQVALKSVKTYKEVEMAQAAAQAVSFVATLESSFEKYDNVSVASPNYGFRFIFRPPQYETYLRSILEDEATFFKQKNRLFDHLLSRFAEDFTDYTLLSFATLRNAGLQTDVDNERVLSRQFAMDKARFLQKYPEISRNRAKAMDFSKPIWTDKNQSGLENRVSKLLGIDERGTKTLNYFDIVQRPTRFRFVISSVHFGQHIESTDLAIYKPLMQSSRTFETAEQALLARTECINLGKNKACFEPTYCLVEQVYGFRLLDKNGCPVAESVDTFGSTELRNSQMNYAHGLMAGEGVMRHFCANTEGVFFEITDCFGGQVRAEQGVDNEKQALLKLVECLKILSVRANWQPINEPSQRGYGFQWIENQSVVATYSVFFKTKKERDARLKAVFDFFKQKNIFWQTQVYPPRYRWQLTGAMAQVLLTSRHYFGSPEQAAAAWHEAQRAILDANFGRLEARRAGEEFAIELQRFSKDDEGRTLRDEYLILAQANFEQASERDAALQGILALAKALDKEADTEAKNFWQNQTTLFGGAAKLNTEGGKFSLNLPIDGNNEDDGLMGDPIFDDEITALAATYSIQMTDTEGIYSVANVAESKDNFQHFTENGGCIFSFNLKNESLDLARFEPYQLTYDAARAKRRTIVAQALAHKLDIQLKTIINQRWFEVLDETCDEELVPILRGEKQTMDLAEISRHFDDFRQKIIDNSLVFEVNQTPDGYYFGFENWGKSVRSFDTETDAKTAAQNFVNALKTRFVSGTDAENESQIVAIEKKCADGGVFFNTNRWRLSDAENSIARYVERVFDGQATDEEVDKWREKLISKYACGHSGFSMVFENTDNIERDFKNNFRFVLRDAQQRYWQSADGYSTDSLALAAFEAQHIGLLTLACDIQNYRIKSRKIEENTVFYIELRNLEGELIAESAEMATDTEGVNDLMARLHKHALLYPIVQKAAESFGFQVFNPTKHVVVWQSLRDYKTAKEAKVAFRQFLDMLKYQGNFRNTVAEDGCQKYIELNEVLLDEVTTLKSKDNAEQDITDCDWQGIEYFVDNLVGAGEAAFVPTVDYLNGCGYGFKLAKTDYRLARHALSFHSKIARELRRDALWHNQRCRKTMTTEGSEFEKIITHIESYFAQHQAVLVECGKGTDEAVSFYKLRISLDNRVFEYNEFFNDLIEIQSFMSRRREALEEARRAMSNYCSWLVLTEDDGSFKLGITRADGSLIFVFEEWATADADIMKTELEHFYEYINFSSEIIALDDGTFGFEIREKTAEKVFVYINGFVKENYDFVPIELPVFNVIWRNIRSYQTAGEAALVVNQVHDLLNNKAHYARTTAADGSPTLEIVDPSRIIAQHPRTYTTPTERHAAWQNVRKHIHTEGMHVVEHLLLRPRFGEAQAILAEIKTQTDVQQHFLNEANNRLLLTNLVRNEAENEPEIEISAFDPTNDDAYFDDYIMGADPYSFWLTVILPHWSARYRDIDFRDFFENTLRRESPAHVALNIVWVNPNQMQQFEKVWRAWLEVAADPTHYLYACRKKKLLAIFKNLKTVTPEAGLLDCTTGATNQLIILDKTTLR